MEKDRMSETEVKATENEITYRVGADPVTGHDRDFRVYEGSRCVAVFYDRDMFEEYQAFLAAKERVGEIEVESSHE
jgi:hypothetical protein